MRKGIFLIGERINRIYFNGITYYLAVDDEKHIYIKNITVNDNDEPEPLRKENENE